MTPSNRKVVTFLSSQYRQAHMLLEATMEGVTAEQVHWLPQGKALPIGAQYAHILTSEDAVINGMLRGAPPLAATTWAGKTGLSEMPPMGRDFWSWSQQVRVDLPALRQFAQAVYDNTEQYLQSIIDEDLSHPLDLSALGAGEQTLGWMLSTMVGNVDHHCGEISCLKGLQGAKGYPM